MYLKIKLLKSKYAFALLQFGLFAFILFFLLLLMVLMDFDSCTCVPNRPELFNFNRCIYSSVHSDEPQRALKPTNGTTLTEGR